MASFRETRELLLLAYSENFISDEEFLILFEIYKGKNPDFPYWIYNPFDLLLISEAECWADFRMYRNDVIVMKNIFNIPYTIGCKKKDNWFRIRGILHFP